MIRALFSALLMLALALPVGLGSLAASTSRAEARVSTSVSFARPTTTVRATRTHAAPGSLSATKADPFRGGMTVVYAAAALSLMERQAEGTAARDTSSLETYGVTGALPVNGALPDKDPVGLFIVLALCFGPAAAFFILRT